MPEFPTDPPSSEAHDLSSPKEPDDQSADSIQPEEDEDFVESVIVELPLKENPNGANPQQDSGDGPGGITETAAKLTSQSASSVKPRTGSPFAVAPPEVALRSRQPKTTILESPPVPQGLWTSTADGAVLSSGMLTLFALVSAFTFSAGALAVTGLGVATGSAGLSSHYPKWALGFLLVHATIFLLIFLGTA